jgi:creatinine amidohydrolase
MRKWTLICAAGMFVVVAGSTSPQQPEQPMGFRLEDYAWPDAEALLRPETVVVIPLGAAASEHGPHLKLRNDAILADYFGRRILQMSSVVVAPTLTYHYYPAFAEYPGSTSVTLESARDFTADVVRSLARFGPKRFYALNTNRSGGGALDPAARALASEGILLTYTDFTARLAHAGQGVRQQAGGSHADEIETSMMLYIDPSSVDMSRAVKDYNPGRGTLRLTRSRGGEGIYSPTGIFGDPTLATAAKGRWAVDSILTAIVTDIERLRTTPLPTPTAAQSASRPAAFARSGAGDPGSGDTRECSEGDLRTVRGVGDAHTYWWANADARELGALWTPGGDVFHPDGMIERGRGIITQNRAALFVRPEYRDSKHPLTITTIRCLSYDLILADGKWELRSVKGPDGKQLPPFEGLCTLVLRRAGDRWLIDAYRYSNKPSSPPPPQMWFKRPGIPGK